MLALALAALLASQPSIDAVEEPLPPLDPLWEVYLAATGGFRTDQPGGGGVGAVGVNRRIGRFIRPELMLGLGAYARPTDAVTAIRIGARFELPNQTRFKPYLWVAFAHNHETAFATAIQSPFDHILGLSENGVNHRSGFDAGLGVAYELPRFGRSSFAGRIGLRAVYTQMLGAGPARQVDFTLTAGVCF